MIVLVVEDNAVNGSTLTNLLRERGHVVEWAVDAYSLRAKLEVVRPDVIIMDWVLPDSDGHDTLKEVSKTSARVIVFTALGPTDLSRVMAEFPAVTFLVKPAMPEEIINVVENTNLEHLSSKILTEYNR